MHRIRKSYFSSVLKQDVSWHDTNTTGDFASAITENLWKIQEALGEKAAIFIFSNTVFVSGFVFSLFLGWELSLIDFSCLPVFLISLGTISWVKCLFCFEDKTLTTQFQFTTRFTQEEIEAYSSASAVAEDVLGSIRTVVAFDGQAKENERYQTQIKHARKMNIRRIAWTGVSTGLMWCLVYARYALSIWYGVKLLINERDLPDDQKTYTSATVISVRISNPPNYCFYFYLKQSLDIFHNIGMLFVFRAMRPFPGTI